MKLIALLLLTAGFCQPLSASDEPRITVKSSSVSNGYISVVAADLNGKVIELGCDKTAVTCYVPTPGEHLMMPAGAGEGIYYDCTNIILHEPSTGRNGVYCWKNSGDCYIVTCFGEHIQVVPSKVPEVPIGHQPSSAQEITVAAAEKPPLVAVAGPTVVAFFPLVTDAEMRKDPDTNESLADFQVYARRVREPFKRAGVEFHELYAHSFRVRVGNATAVFCPGKAEVGYYFIAPGKRPRIEYGVRTDDDLFNIANQYFGLHLK